MEFLEIETVDGVVTEIKVLNFNSLEEVFDYYNKIVEMNTDKIFEDNFKNYRNEYKTFNRLYVDWKNCVNESICITILPKGEIKC